MKEGFGCEKSVKPSNELTVIKAFPKTLELIYNTLLLNQKGLTLWYVERKAGN